MNFDDWFKKLVQLGSEHDFPINENEAESYRLYYDDYPNDPYSALAEEMSYRDE